MKKDKITPSANTFCRRCSNACKQPAEVKIIKCPNFIREPEQLEIPLFISKTSKKDK